MSGLRPQLNLLTDSSLEEIVDRAWAVLEQTGVQIEDPAVLESLAKIDFRVDLARQRAFFERKQAESFVNTAPSSFRVYGRDDEEGIEIGGAGTVYDPGSAAVYWLDPGTAQYRRAETRDCAALAQLTEGLDGYQLQSTGVVPSDVPEPIADCCRLFFALVHCRKPVITGTFRAESFVVMERLLEVIAGSHGLCERPPAIFDCCPSPPLRWSHLTLSALLDCARSGLPAELVSMPLAGATAPVTLIGAVTQHTAECLSGVILHQMVGPGAPIVWGGSPAAFDMRHGTPPMGAMETMMIDLAYAQVGRHLGFPTHAYMACSDAKLPDYQAGMESGIGAVLAALGGVNVVSGPGFLNYENTQSPEKLILDHDAIGLAFRLIEGIHTHPEVDPTEILARHAEDGKFLADPTTRKLHRQEISPPGRCVDRGPVDSWVASGSPDARATARREVDKILAAAPNRLDEKRTHALRSILLDAAKKLDLADVIAPLLG